MRKIVSSIILTLLLAFTTLSIPSSASAATFRSGDTVNVDTQLSDLYASGGTVTITAPVSHDLTTAGGTININNNVTGGVLAAGGTITSKGQVDNSFRAAGGTITISGPIKRDLVLFGGSITIDETASVSGDLIVSGGTVNIQSPVAGNIIVNGGQVTLNAPVGGNVKGDVGTLILGTKAVINGNLTYAGPERATLRDGAVLKGQEDFTQTKHDENKGEKVAGIVTTWSFYKLIADILASLALIYLLYAFTSRVIDYGRSEPVKQGLLGFATLILTPIIGIFLFILILPGLVTFLMYAVLLILSAFISKLFIGNAILRWWYGRNNDRYVLDWKAAVVGPIVMFLLLLIPVLGWFIGFLIFLVALGGLMSEVVSWVSTPERSKRTVTRAEETKPSRTTVRQTRRSVRRSTKRTSR